MVISYSKETFHFKYFRDISRQGPVSLILPNCPNGFLVPFVYDGFTKLFAPQALGRSQPSFLQRIDPNRLSRNFPDAFARLKDAGMGLEN